MIRKSTVTDLDRRIALMETEIVRLKRERNSLVPVCRLPSELLVAIFATLQQPDTRDEPWTWSTYNYSWVRVLSVCSRFHATAVQHATLWDVLVYDNFSAQSWFDFCAQRARSTPLCVTDAHSISAHQLPRARAARVSISASASCVNAHQGIGPALPFLTRLDLSHPCVNKGSNIGQLIAVLNHAPRMEELSLTRLDPQGPVAGVVTLPHLRALSIYDSAVAVPVLLSVLPQPSDALGITITDEHGKAGLLTVDHKTAYDSVVSFSRGMRNWSSLAAGVVEFTRSGNQLSLGHGPARFLQDQSWRTQSVCACAVLLSAPYKAHALFSRVNTLRFSDYSHANARSGIDESLGIVHMRDVRAIEIRGWLYSDLQREVKTWLLARKGRVERASFIDCPQCTFMFAEEIVREGLVSEAIWSRQGAVEPVLSEPSLRRT